MSQNPCSQAIFIKRPSVLGEFTFLDLDHRNDELLGGRNPRRFFAANFVTGKLDIPNHGNPTATGVSRGNQAIFAYTGCRPGFSWFGSVIAAISSMATGGGPPPGVGAHRHHLRRTQLAWFLGS